MRYGIYSAALVVAVRYGSEKFAFLPLLISGTSSFGGISLRPRKYRRVREISTGDVPRSLFRCRRRSENLPHASLSRVLFYELYLFLKEKCPSLLLPDGGANCKHILRQVHNSSPNSFPWIPLQKAAMLTLVGRLQQVQILVIRVRTVVPE